MNEWLFFIYGVFIKYKKTRINTSFFIDIRIHTYYDIYVKGRRYQDMPMTAKQMIKYLKQNGFQEVPGGGGSHRKFYNPDTRKTTIVPYHCKDLKKGMEQAILKQAGLKK